MKTKTGIWKEFFVRVFKTEKKEDNIELLNISPEALKYYQEYVKGNKHTTLDQARRKMTRNMMLAACFKEENKDTEKHRVWYAYGCLRFGVENGEVVKMKNWCKVRRGWEMDYEKYEILNKKLGIEAD